MLRELRCIHEHLVDQDDDGTPRFAKLGDKAELLSVDEFASGITGYCVGLPVIGAVGHFEIGDLRSLYCELDEWPAHAAVVCVNQGFCS